MKIVKQNSIINIKVAKKIVSAKIRFGEEITKMQSFFYQPIGVSYDKHGYEIIEKQGCLQKIVRFCPNEIGEYFVDLYDKNGVCVDTKAFCSIPSSNQKPLRIKNGEIFDDKGKSFLPIGINMSFPDCYQNSNGQEFGLSKGVSYLGLQQYEKWFQNFSKNGGNFVRIWCSSAYWSVDKDDSLEEFEYAQFSKLDKLFQLANKYNLRIKLTIEKFRRFVNDPNEAQGIEYINNYIFNKYAVYQGEIVQTDAWLDEEKYRKLWLKKLEEYKLRYACNPALLAVEFFNEMNCFDASEYSKVTNWNIYMAKESREMFPNQILLNSLGSLDYCGAHNQYESFPFEKFDWLQVHSYLDQASAYDEVATNSIEGIKKCASLLKNKQIATGKPLYLAETGAVNNSHSGPFRYYLSDDDGLIFVDCIYTPLFLGFVGSGAIWHWDSRYVSAKNLYKYYKPLYELTKSIDFKKESFQVIDASNDEVYAFILKGNTQYLAFIRNKEYSWQNVLKDNKRVQRRNTTIDFAQIQVGDVEIVKIWTDERVKAEYLDGKLKINNLMRGTLLKGAIKE